MKKEEITRRDGGVLPLGFLYHEGQNVTSPRTLKPGGTPSFQARDQYCPSLRYHSLFSFLSDGIVYSKRRRGELSTAKR